jgi:hypothetical protein
MIYDLRIAIYEMLSRVEAIFSRRFESSAHANEILDLDPYLIERP